MKQRKKTAPKELYWLHCIGGVDEEKKKKNLFFLVSGGVYKHENYRRLKKILHMGTSFSTICIYICIVFLQYWKKSLILIGGKERERRGVGISCTETDPIMDTYEVITIVLSL